jgi:hypothetical protein
MVDLGTLADIGYPEYKSSYATSTNRLGTLIVGWSGKESSCIGCGPTWPVVWTPAVEWQGGMPQIKWKIHKLDTDLFPGFDSWNVFGVNDFGQIIAHGFGPSGEVPVLWNPIHDGKGWKAMAIKASPVPTDLTFLWNINDRGEIAGTVVSEDYGIWLPRFWKPLDFQRETYSDPIPLALPAGYSDGGYPWGMNDVGDMTGVAWGEAGSTTVHWTPNDPSFSEVIGASTDWWSWSSSVNNNRIAVLTYGDEKCGSCGRAVRLH